MKLPQISLRDLFVATLLVSVPHFLSRISYDLPVRCGILTGRGHYAADPSAGIF